MEMMMTEEAALSAATLLLAATLVVPRLTSRWSLWTRAVWRVSALIVLTALIQNILGSPIEPQFHTGQSGLRLWEKVVAIGWWLIAAQGAIEITRLFVVFETRPRETRIISDLLAGVIYLVTFLAIINFVFAVPIAGLLATSGVIAIVLGLALQSSLADVFSGIAVGIERPYAAGDFLWIEGGIEGRVVQINWRSTHIATVDADVAIIPNSVMAKARLVNHSRPTTARSRSISIRLDARERPERCMGVLTAAVKACMLIESHPPPSVARTELNGDGAGYEIGFSVSSSAAITAARTELLGQVQHHLRHAGISLAVSGRVMVPPTKIPSAGDLLKESEWFGVLEPEDRAILAEHLREVSLRTGESLISRDEKPQAVFIIVSGAVEISDGSSENKRIITRMGPASSLGAIGMITGAPYAANATALTPVTAYRLDKEAISAALAFRPEMVKTLEALARRGQDLLHNDVVARESDRLEPPNVFLASLQSFLHKLSVAASAR
jgi:small-conductance mechanosensitive channel/CRP-like cAMP-binding protein